MGFFMITLELLQQACKRVFPGVAITVQDSVGCTALRFWVWQFEVLFTVVTRQVSHQDHIGETWYEVRLRWPKTRGFHLIRKELGLNSMCQVEKSLMWMQELFNGVAASIAMAQVDPYDIPVDLFGNGAKTDCL